tara:strand:- start:634 stop:1545 length:912 start_codon:yes stop_codon:yes gene_type:complete
MKKKTTKITELVIDEENEALAIDAISLVTSPALEVDFVFFGKEKNNLTFAKVDEEKRELIAPALIPNKQIYRYDANTDSDYYVYFSKDTVKNAAYSYLKHNNHHKATYQHEQRVAGVLTVESWIKEGDSDKSTLYGFDLPNGSWFVKMSIQNDDLWQKIKEGELKGLSIEGYFVDKLEKMNKTFTDEEIQTAYKELQAEGKIELGLVDDILKDAKKLSSKFETAVKNNMKIAKLVNDNFKEMGNLVKAAKKGMEFIKKTDKGFKDLGIKPPSEYKKATQDIYDVAEGSGAQMFKDLAKFKGLL